MANIYCDHIKEVKPMGDGVAEAMASAAELSEKEAQTVIDETKEHLNKLLHGYGTDNLFFTQGSAQALDLVIKSILKSGDHVLVSGLEADHVYKTLNEIGHEDTTEGEGVCYTMMPCTDKGQVLIYDPANDPEIFGPLEKLIRPETKAIILSHVCDVCGAVMQAKEIGEFAHRHDLIYIVNVENSAGYVPVFMKLWNIDVMTFSGGHGLMSTKEAGGFLVSDRAMEMLGGIEGCEALQTVEMAPIAGLHQAFEYIKEMTLYQLSHTAQKRAEQFLRKVQHVNGVYPVGPGYNDRVPAVALRTDFMPCEMLAAILKEKYDITVSAGLMGCERANKTLGTYPDGVLRFSFNHTTPEWDVEEVVKAMWQQAAQNDTDVTRMPKE